MREYLVIYGSDLFGLSEKVNELIRQGWEPQGGVNAFYTAAGYHYHQAMVNIPAVARIK